ncbi:MAG: transcriptional repressor [Selenomonadales bacterium]|nr:transcriptional repressor [Selenomonadales bacterium]
MNISMDELKQKLQARQYKMTPQRQIVLQVFLKQDDKHFSAEEVHKILRDQEYEIGLATVYRTLDLLVELAILQKIEFGDGCSRYELSKVTDGHHHHHLICLDCGEVMEFGDDLLETLESKIEAKCGFQIADHEVKFFGYCQKCRK